MLADHQRLDLPGGSELIQRPVALAASRLQNRGGQAHQQPDAGLAVGLCGAPGAVQPLFGDVELASPDQRVGEGCQRRGGHGFGLPAVPRRHHDGFLAALPGHCEGTARGGEPQVGEAGHLQIGPADPACKGGAFAEVPFTVGQPQRPCLGDAKVEERDGFQVAAGRSAGTRLTIFGAQKSSCLLEDAVEVPAQPRRQQINRGDRRLQPVPRDRRHGGRVRPDLAQVRIGLVEAKLVLVGDSTDQAQVGRVLPGPGREGAQQRRDGARVPVEGQADGVVGEQAGGLIPLARGLQVADGIGRLAMLGEPARSEFMQAGDVRRHSAAQFQPE